MIKCLANYNHCRLINSEEVRSDPSKCHAKLPTDKIHLRAITVVSLNVKYLSSFGSVFYQMTKTEAYKQHQTTRPNSTVLPNIIAEVFLPSVDTFLSK